MVVGVGKKQVFIAKGEKSWNFVHAVETQSKVVMFARVQCKQTPN
jgi:hypothetical protein